MVKLAIKQISTLLRNKRYWFIIITIASTSAICGIAINEILKIHKVELVHDVCSKSVFVLKSIEKDAAISVMLDDTLDLQKLILRYYSIDSSIVSIAFFSADLSKITGLGELPNKTMQKIYHYESSETVNTFYSMQDRALNPLGYILIKYSKNRLFEATSKLLLKTILIALTLISLITILLIIILLKLQTSIQNELEASNRSKEYLNNEKLQKVFLANMSHELRTPLSAIIGFINIIRRKSQTRENSKFFELIIESGDLMTVLINDILDFSKIQEGSVELEYHHFDFNKLFNVVCTTLEHKVKNAVYYNFKEIGNSACYVYGDYYRIKQIMINLVSNAIKFTGDGEIKISYSKVASNGIVKINFSVCDSGIGVKKSKEVLLFKPFSQLHEFKDSSKGTGLGLTISKNLVELMGGEISYRPNTIKGSTFFFELELPIGEEDKIFNDKKNKSSVVQINLGARLLIAEDNEINQLLIKTIFNNLGYDNFDFAKDGLEAIEMLKSDDYDLILMDIQMPKMGGVEATKKIRKSKEAYSKIPIIALTANAIKGDKEFFIKSGMNGYVSKPINENLLVEELTKYIPVNVIKSDELLSDKSEKTKSTLLNLEQLNKKFKGNNELTLKLLSLFIDSINEEIPRMIGAFEVGNYLEISSIAHKIKPSIDYICEIQDQELIRKIENKEEKSNSDDLIADIHNFEERMNLYLIEAKDIITQTNQQNITD
jgi:signal transduction histidine kinase/DNA-binding response OmpR family regulator